MPENRLLQAAAEVMIGVLAMCKSSLLTLPDHNIVKVPNEMSGTLRIRNMQMRQEGGIFVD